MLGAGYAQKLTLGCRIDVLDEYIVIIPRGIAYKAKRKAIVWRIEEDKHQLELWDQVTAKGSSHCDLTEYCDWHVHIQGKHVCERNESYDTYSS